MQAAESTNHTRLFQFKCQDRFAVVALLSGAIRITMCVASACPAGEGLLAYGTKVWGLRYNRLGRARAGRADKGQAGQGQVGEGQAGSGQVGQAR